MFEDSLFASNTQHYPNGWTTFASIAIQVLLVATAMVVPVLFTDSIPRHAFKELAQLPAAPRIAAEEARPSIRPAQRSEVIQQAIRVPQSIPRTITPVIDRARDFEVGTRPALVGSAGAAGGDSSLLSLTSTGRSIAPTIATPSKRLKVSGGIEQGLLIRNVKPVYPAIARQAGIQGEVILQAVIGKDGHIEKLHAVSGHPMLIKAALDAVQQWLYRPYLLNGEPVEVETQITVRFTVS
jgi:protein TonB